MYRGDNEGIHKNGYATETHLKDVYPVRKFLPAQREVVGSKPCDLPSVGGDSVAKNGSELDELVMAAATLLTCMGPLEEQEIRMHLDPKHTMVVSTLSSSLPALLLQERRGFCSCTEGDRTFYYYDPDDDILGDEDNSQIAISDTGCGTSPKVVTAIGTTAAVFAPAVHTIAEAVADSIPTAGKEVHQNLLVSNDISRSMTPESSGSLYESADDGDSLPSSLVSSFTCEQPLQSAAVRRRGPPLVPVNRGTQTEALPLQWDWSVPTTDVQTTAYICTQTDAPKPMEEVHILRALLKRCNSTITELQEQLSRVKQQHREETDMLHRKVAALQAQLENSVGVNGKEMLAAKETPAEDEICHLHIEPNKETNCVSSAEDKTVVMKDKTTVPDFYELLEHQDMGGSRRNLNLDSQGSSCDASPSRSKLRKKEQEDMIIRKVQQKKPKMTEAEVREHLNRFREMQCSLSGMSIKAIVAGVLALINQSSQSMQHK